jgi:histidine kinase
VNESLALAALASSLAAVAASLLVSRRVVVPVRAMLAASRRMAAGHYAERVSVPGTSEELDELGQLALSFNQMAATLESTEARRRDLIADVAHELRTPLASIQGYMEGLMDGVVPADATTYEKVHHEAGRLRKLVQDLQELSQVESGAFTLDLHPVSVASLVATVVARLGLQFEEKGVDLTTDVPTDLPSVKADEDRTGQVLLNLVGNALHYTPAGGKVRLWARHEGTEVHLAVEDTGIGIRPEHVPHVFERFYRVDKSRSRVGGGSGIGLTIAKHLLEAQGGRIWAESPGPARGSTLHFTLPVA